MDQEEISEKIRKAIKAKLTELGSYIDDELPDYIMVMIANKKPVDQMTSDLDLFLGDNADPFTQWLENLLNRLQSVAKSVVKAEPKSTTLGPSDSKQKRVKNESQPQSAGDRPLTLAASVVAPPPAAVETTEGYTVEDEAEDGELVTQPAAVLTLHAQEEDEVEFEDDDDDDEPVIQPKTIPKQSTAPKSRNSASVRPAVSKARSAVTKSHPKSSSRSSDGVKSEKLARTSEAPSDLLAARKRMISTRGDSEAFVPRAEVQPSRRAIQPPAPTRDNTDDRNRSRSPPPRRRSSDIGRGRSRSRSPATRRGPVSARLGRSAVSGNNRDKLDDRLRDLASGRRDEHRPRDGDSRREDYRRDRDRDRPAAGYDNRDRSGRDFRPFTKRPVWREAGSGRDKSPSGGEVTSQLGASVPRVDLVSDDSDEEGQVGGLASVLKIPERRSSVPEKLQANRKLLMKAMAEVNKSVPAPNLELVTVEDSSSDPDKPSAEQRTDTKRLSAKQRIGSTRSPRGQPRPQIRTGGVRDLAERINRRSPDYKRRKSRSLSRSRSRSPLDYDEEDLLEVIALLKEKKRRKQQGAESVPDEPVKDTTVTHKLTDKLKKRVGDRRRQEGDVRLRLGRRDGGYRNEEILANRSPSPEQIGADETGNRASGGASPKFVVTLDAVSDMSKLLPYAAAGTLDIDDLDLLDNSSADAAMGSDTNRTEDDIISMDLNSPSIISGDPTDISNILCRFLPNCKAGDVCPFLHPICKNYPNCRFGSSCKYKHPGITSAAQRPGITSSAGPMSSIMCKFDVACTKPNCPYKHTNPKKLVNPGVVLSHLKLNPTATVKPPSKTICRFHPKCTNMDCVYLHPMPCKFGLSCMRRTSGCKFSHPSLPTKTQLKWSKPAAADKQQGNSSVEVTARS